MLHWLTIISGIVMIAVNIALRLDAYSSGMNFNKSDVLIFAPLLIPVILMMVVGCVLIVIGVFRRSYRPRSLLILLVPVAVFWIPSLKEGKGFDEGMADRVKRDFQPQQLAEFAAAAREMGLNSLPHHEYNGKLAELEKRFPEVMEISTIPARVFVKETYVDVFFDSALVKHWGMRIVDAGEGTRPFTVQENVKAIEALPRVWVYRLPY